MPLSSVSFTPMPRPPRSPSCTTGFPPPLENRTSAGTGVPRRNGARQSAPPSGVAVNVPSAQAPFTWTTRPSCSPNASCIALDRGACQLSVVAHGYLAVRDHTVWRSSH